MAKIMKNWSGEKEGSFIKKIEEKIHRTPSLQEKISDVIWKLKLQHEQLEHAILKMQRHDKELFEKCVEAQVAEDTAKATIYANECAEIRKMAKIILLSQLAIEKVMLRLETIQEFGNVFTELAPVSGVVKALKGKLAGVLPQVSYELDSIGELLNGMMVESGRVTNIDLPVETEGEESKKILGEASLIAEQKLKEKFPEMSSPEKTVQLTHEKTY